MSKAVITYIVVGEPQPGNPCEGLQPPKVPQGVSSEAGCGIVPASVLKR